MECPFPALRIGVAEYSAGPTGCTVFLFPEGGALALDVRGGSPAYVGDYGWTHAICLAGGSVYGLEAASGVAAELFAQGGYPTEWDRLALVSGAIMYDYHDRGNSVYPDKELGRAAVRAARPGAFPLGARGAGASVRVGSRSGGAQSERSGQGGAFGQFGPTKVAVFSVVNAVGAILGRNGAVVRGNLDPETGRRLPPTELLASQLPDPSAPPAPGNTTLTVLVTNQKLDPYQLKQLGRQVHSSMARAIQPFHTMYDGDVLFSVSTNEVERPSLDVTTLGGLASELAWDAVLASVPGDERSAPPRD